MKKIIQAISIFAFCFFYGQTNPAITSWIKNTTGIIGRYYVSGNSTAMSNGISANVQNVYYNSTDVYIKTNGIPSYPVGPYLDGNPNQAGSQNAIFKFPLTPQQNTGTATATTLGNIGVFINGVALFDYRDGVSWKSSSNSFAGGPLGGTGDGVWNRDAVVYEKAGFDCAKGHPAGTNYHHHQNPSAFKLDTQVISTICNLYDSDGLYTINPSQHSPLLGFAYDGFPIYGAYGYANTNGTGGIVRMKSGYQLRNITVRNTYSNGTSVTSGPNVSTTYPLGTFREDYEFISHPSDASYLDEHNGRFCVTPEYPNGTYAYFCTVDANHNSAYPYAVGPTFYGIYANRKVTSVPSGVTEYVLATKEEKFNDFDITITPNPASDFIAVQVNKGLIQTDLDIVLLDNAGRKIKTNKLYRGSTISFIDTQTLYNGMYFVVVSSGNTKISKKVIINKD